MNETIFTLNEGTEYIELYKLLKVTSICGTGGEAKMRIADGEAKINGEITTVKRLKIRPDMRVEFAGQILGVEIFDKPSIEPSVESSAPSIKAVVESSVESSEASIEPVVESSTLIEEV